MATPDAVAFLRATPPFNALSAALFDAAAATLETGHYPAGAQLVRAGAEPLQHLHVIRQGAVRLERQGRTLQVLEEGETFGYTSLITGKATLDVRVEEDLLTCRLPAAQFQRLLGDARFAGHFALGIAERLRHSLERSPVATSSADLRLEVGKLLQGPAVWVEPGASVGEAARAMRDRRISSVLIRGDPPAIVTDRDFRNSVLAEGLGPETPVATIGSRPLRAVDATVPVSAAWATLLGTGGHHLPIRRGGEIVGVLTASDLLKVHVPGPAAVLRRVERMADRSGLPGYAAQVTEMVTNLLAGGLEADHIAGIVARLNDALLRRLLAFAEAELGAPPAPYAWVVMGSEGRMEQTLLTDQDNALVFDDAGEQRRSWYQALAERVNADLEAAGFPPCHGGYMARNWLGSVSVWVQRLDGWLEERRPQELLEASLFFDVRKVGGTLDIEPLEDAISRAAQYPIFLRYLARAALDLRPPNSLLLRLRETTEVDLKMQGLTPIVLLARCYGLEIGSRERNTRARLAAAVKAGLMSQEIFEVVGEAYRFLLGLRLREQVKQAAEGRPVVNKLAFRDRSAIERGRLKDAFRAIKGWQDMAAYHYQAAF